MKNQTSKPNITKKTISKNFRRPSFKPAFSILEIMASLVVISLVVAAFVPVISKRVVKSGSGDAVSDAYYVGEPRSQADCDAISKALLFVETDSGNHCITRFNVGDYVSGLGYKIPSSAGVKIVNTGQTCGALNNYTAKCCWQGKTSDECDTSGGYYSGCNRTVCTWAAADAICSALGMRQPTNAELKDIYDKYSKEQNNKGPQFCDIVQAEGSSWCKPPTNKCLGTTNGSCHPHSISSVEYDANRNYRAQADGGKMNYSIGYKSYARSVRCILDKVQIGSCTGDECGCGVGKYLEGSSCAACPQGYYCDDGESKTMCPSGTYSDVGQAACSPCPDGHYCENGVKKPCIENCKTCSNSTTCSVCNDGYKTNDSLKCVQAGCPQPWQMEVEISGVKYCFTKFNVGDFVDGVGVDIPASAGVTTVSAGESCNGKCCWKATSTVTTADSENCNSKGGSYSGCTRTLCNWHAVDAICSSLGMIITPQAFIKTIYTDYSKNLGDDGAQFCDYRVGYGTQCYTTNKCLSSGNGSSCDPYSIWSREASLGDAKAYCVSYDSGNYTSFTDFQTKVNVKSARCIIPKAATGACTVSECGCGVGYYISGSSCKLCEEGYYCSGGSKTPCPSGRYVKPGATSATECITCPDNCVACSDTNTCTKCADGYELTSDGKCQKACQYSWQMPVVIGGVDYCFTKFNVGDFVNGVGVDIPSSAGVKTLSMRTSCSTTAESYATKCCWIGSTNTETDCDSAGGSYSGCYRTVCTWAAADAICSALGMQLPIQAQYEAIYQSYSKDLGDNGAQFCSNYANKGLSWCGEVMGRCPVSLNNSYYAPSSMWSTEYSDSAANTSNGTSRNNGANKLAPASVRCIKQN